jgi:acyl-CoA synthetase (NDP forming)
MDKLKTLDRIFNPKTVAVVGDKFLNNNYMWLQGVKSFQGNVYSVNIDPKEAQGIEALGIKNYPSILDIPEPVDYAFVSIPREVIPAFLRDCAQKKVGGVALFTSGYNESDTPEGRRFQEELLQLVSELKITLIGPNCVGVLNPKLGLRLVPALSYVEEGSVGFISQSGRNLMDFAGLAYRHGIKISKGISYGNAFFYDSPDFLEYLINDEETKIIGMYIEGIKDGRRLFQILKEAANKKPIVIWKGGQTEAGSRATYSHTGSLAESSQVWRAAIRQARAIEANGIEEMVDIIKLLALLPPVPGYRLGIISMNGGQCVAMADTFSKVGLEIPLLSNKSYERLAPILRVVGASYKNPIDMGLPWYLFQAFKPTLEILKEEERIDTVILEVPALFIKMAHEAYPDFANLIYDTIFEFEHQCEKPVLVMLPPSFYEEVEREVENRFLQKGIATFNSYSRAALALKKVTDYYCLHPYPLTPLQR